MAARDADMSGDADDVGYGKPPKSSRFGKGASGNPNRRPTGRHRHAPYEAVLGQMVIIRDDGVEKAVSAAEAFMLKLSNDGLQDDGAAARLAMTAIETATGKRRETETHQITSIVQVIVEPGSVGSALEPLRIAKKMDRYRDNARILLEPCVVQKALSRLGARRLKFDDQKTVLEATRVPKKVEWPEWWKALP